MRFSDIQERIVDMRFEIEDFMLEIAGSPFDCEIEVGNEILIKIETNNGMVEFIEIGLSNFGAYTIIKSPGFEDWEYELLEFIDELQV